MPDYGQFCPVSRGAEVFAERWTPLILGELLNGSHRFSEIQLGLPRISRNLLTQRLASLTSAGVIERRRVMRGRGFSYHLTPAGGGAASRRGCAGPLGLPAGAGLTCRRGNWIQFS